MSSLTTTSINTANGSTPLTVGTGNTSGPAIIVSGGTDVAIRANTSANVFIANSSGLRANAALTVANTLTVTGQATLNTVANGVSFAGNTTFANVVATSVRTTNTVVTSNSLTLGTSSIATSGHSRLPNGLLVQWGTTASIATSGTTVTFPVAFSAAPYSVVLTAVSATASFRVNTTSTTNFTANSSAASTAYYMAIGLGT